MQSNTRSAINLLVTDMVMPGMTGRELARRLQHQHSGIGVVYMSGYSEQTAAETTQVEENMLLLTKPFSRGSILRAVREALNVSRST